MFFKVKNGLGNSTDLVYLNIEYPKRIEAFIRDKFQPKEVKKDRFFSTFNG